jgi:hypothetical protein
MSGFSMSGHFITICPICHTLSHFITICPICHILSPYVRFVILYTHNCRFVILCGDFSHFVLLCGDLSYFILFCGDFYLLPDLSEISRLWGFFPFAGFVKNFRVVGIFPVCQKFSRLWGFFPFAGFARNFPGCGDFSGLPENFAIRARCNFFVKPFTTSLAA